MAALRVHRGSDGVLYLAGELDLESETALGASAHQTLDGRSELVLDLTDLSFVDSNGIRSLIRLAREISPSRLVLRHPEGEVARVLDVVRIDGTFGIRVDTEPAA